MMSVAGPEDPDETVERISDAVIAFMVSNSPSVILAAPACESPAATWCCTSAAEVSTGTVQYCCGSGPLAGFTPLGRLSRKPLEFRIYGLIFLARNGSRK